MKAFLVPLLAALCLPNLGHARLGETPEEIEARFGKPTERQEKPMGLLGTEMRIYHNKTFVMAVIFWEGKSAAEMVQRQDRKKLTSVEVQKLLGFNGAEWKSGAEPGYWDLPDRAAQLTDHGKTLLMQTRHFLKNTPLPSLPELAR